jgi:hypothetical protein
LEVRVEDRGIKELGVLAFNIKVDDRHLEFLGAL